MYSCPYFYNITILNNKGNSLPITVVDLRQESIGFINASPNIRIPIQNFHINCKEISNEFN